MRMTVSSSSFALLKLLVMAYLAPSASSMTVNILEEVWPEKRLGGAEFHSFAATWVTLSGPFLALFIYNITKFISRYEVSSFYMRHQTISWTRSTYELSGTAAWWFDEVRQLVFVDTLNEMEFNVINNIIRPIWNFSKGLTHHIQLPLTRTTYGGAVEKKQSTRVIFHRLVHRHRTLTTSKVLYSILQSE